MPQRRARNELGADWFCEACPRPTPTPENAYFLEYYDQMVNCRSNEDASFHFGVFLDWLKLHDDLDAETIKVFMCKAAVVEEIIKLKIQQGKDKLMAMLDKNPVKGFPRN